MRFLLLGVKFNDDGEPTMSFRQRFKFRYKAVKEFHLMAEGGDYCSIRLLDNEGNTILSHISKEGEEYVKQILGKNQVNSK